MKLAKIGNNYLMNLDRKCVYMKCARCHIISGYMGIKCMWSFSKNEHKWVFFMVVKPQNTGFNTCFFS